MSAVYTIEDRLMPITPEPLGATFISTDLVSGDQLAWCDSTVQEPGGRNAHVYWYPLRVAYDRAYRLEKELVPPADALLAAGFRRKG